MKVLHVNGAFSEGGVEQYLSQLFEELNKRGHQSLFLHSQDTVGCHSLPNVETFYIKDITSVYCEDLDNKLKIVEEITDREDPDLVYIHQVLNSSLIDLLIKRRPSIRFVHGFKLVCPDGKKTLITIPKTCPYPLGYSCQARAYQYRCMPRNPFIGLPLIYHSKRISQIHRRRGHVVVASGFMKSVLRHNGFDENKIHVIPYFTYLPESKNMSDSINRPVILSLGRIVAVKGMQCLLRALPAIHKKPRLVIVGDGPALVELKSLAKQLGISSRVSFPGWLSHEKLDQLYRQSSLVVVPSIWPEPFGIVGIEAMAYQKPVIAFDVGGISEWLKEGETGFLVNPGDEAGLTERINSVLKRPDLAQEMGKKGRATVETRFSANAHLELLIPLFEKAIDNSLG